MNMLPKIRRIHSRIPIKWKLALWAAILLFLFFAAYNVTQYMLMSRWIVNQEKMDMEQEMREILDYFLENEKLLEDNELFQVRNYLYRVNKSNQVIRLMDEQGRRMLAVTNDIPESWIDNIMAPTTGVTALRQSGQSLLLLRSPLHTADFKGTVEIARSREEYRKLRVRLIHVMVAFAASAAVLSILGGQVLARQLLRPLQALAATIKNIRQRGLQERMPPGSNTDELSTLSNMFNTMMDEVERAFQQQSQFVQDAAHELWTPVTIIEGHLALLERWGKENPAVLEESLQASIQELLRLKGLVQELLALMNAESGELEEMGRVADPVGMIRHIVRNMLLLYPAFRFQVRVDELFGVSLDISVQHLEQILLIILDNAVKYSGNARSVEIAGVVGAPEEIHIRIKDYGIGIPADDLPYVLDRFYRVDKVRRRGQGGNGLGLSIAKRLAERHSGSITISSTEGEGTEVTVTLPAIVEA